METHTFNITGKTLTITIPDEDIETAMEHVLYLIREGYTSGYYPTWELS